MPVHLFGRPAPIEELRALRPAARRGRRAGVRLARDRDERRLDVQLLPVEEPLRARRRRPDRRATTPSSPSGSGCCASTARGRRRTSSTSATTRGSTRSRPRRCGSSCRTSTSGRACAARLPRATPSSGSPSSPSCRRTSRATSTTCTPCARPSATGSPTALAEAGIGHAAFYTTPLHLQPALRYLGYSEGDLPETEKAARENLCLPLWGGISRGAAGAGRRRAPARVEPRRRRDRASRHPAPPLAAARRRRADRRRVAAHVLPPLRRGRPALLPRVPLVARGRGRASRSTSRPSSSAASTTAGGATSRRATCGASRAASRSARCSPTSCCSRSRPSTPRRCRAASPRSTSCSCSRSSPGSRLLARTLLERPQSGLVAHGKEVLIVGAGNAGQLLDPRDPAQPRARLHADRLHRRRPEEAEAEDPRRPRARHDRRARRGSCARTARTRC